MKTETKVYDGKLYLHYEEEEIDVLFLSSLVEPLSKKLMYDINNKNITVRYWTSPIRKTKDELLLDVVMMCTGVGIGDYCAHYSELTGYLWTDEEFNVGGHNILNELKSHVGQWLYMEIEIHDK